jgi:hypothetical protein
LVLSENVHTFTKIPEGASDSLRMLRSGACGLDLILTLQSKKKKNNLKKNAKIYGLVTGTVS